MKNICVYCGSSPGRLPEYADTAVTLARELVKHDIGLVYGGASVGVMGTIADAVLAAGGRVTGVIPQMLVDKEVAHAQLSELHIVKSMHERKTLMAELSDGFIALPGGLGTLEELFEILTWALLGLHQKPCALLNVAGYYDHLSAFLDHATHEQFIKPAQKALLMIAENPEMLIARMINFVPSGVNKWIDLDQT